MAKFTLPKGMKDIEPEEMAKREYVCARIKDVLLRYGFRLAEPSALENLETLTAKSGPALENEIYAFEDKSKRRLGLRFDLTVGMARMVANSEFPKPVRLACISNMWRYDNPQYARYRSFWQWDAEIYGCSEAAADAEIISLMCGILSSFNLDFEIRISNRKLVEGFLMGMGVDKNSLMGVLRVIDKKAKISEKEMEKEFVKYGMKKEQIRNVLQFCGLTSLAKINTVLPKNQLAQEGLKELEDLFDTLGAYGIQEKCRIDLSIVRGIDYYTGVVYEAWVKGENDIGAVAGGGRYDDLLGLYGRPMAATGVAGGIERLLLSLDKTLKEIPSKKTLFVAYATVDMFSEALKITQTARKKGITTIIDTSRRSLGKQMEYADKSGVDFTLVIGPKEVKERRAKLRDMKTGEEKEISLDKIDEIRL